MNLNVQKLIEKYMKEPKTNKQKNHQLRWFLKLII